jgi:sugar O-acyltransferase (sialic acid O-acetyltransferase NeuD family)
MSQNSKHKLLIVGTGDYAQMAYFYLSDTYEIIGFSEESAFRKKDTFESLPIYNFEEINDFFNSEEVKVFVAVGPNKVNTVRERLYKEVTKKNFKCINYIHPKAYVWDHKAIGENSFIFPNCVVEPYASVGNNCVMWSGAMLAHHSILEDNNFMAPGASVSGRTMIKKNCFLGINSTVRDNVIVAENTIIGAGAVIKKNTEKDGVYSVKRTDLYNQNSANTKV